MKFHYIKKTFLKGLVFILFNYDELFAALQNGKSIDEIEAEFNAVLTKAFDNWTELELNQKKKKQRLEDLASILENLAVYAELYYGTSFQEFTKEEILAIDEEIEKLAAEGGLASLIPDGKKKKNEKKDVEFAACQPDPAEKEENKPVGNWYIKTCKNGEKPVIKRGNITNSDADKILKDFVRAMSF